MRRLREILARLRAPGGCPWDHEQTHESLRRHLVEECCELLEAIDRGDPVFLCEELGDVLLQVVFHAQIASEAGRFDLEDVARGIADKLVRRHPHVFGGAVLATAGEVVTQWEAIKRAEKGIGADAPEPLVKPAPALLPALLRAVEVHKQLSKRAALPGIPLHDEAEVAELAAGLDAASAGARLFALAAACRLAGLDPEAALREHLLRVVDAAERSRAATAP